MAHFQNFCYNLQSSKYNRGANSERNDVQTLIQHVFSNRQIPLKLMIKEDKNVRLL